MDNAKSRAIFTPIKIGSKTAKNRIALSPMGVNLENADGSVSRAALEYFTARARGGAGIIITGSANVSYPAGRSVPHHLRLDKAEYIPGWGRLAEEVHRYGSLLFIQLMHAGNSANPLFLNGFQPESASEMPNAYGGSCRELSNDEVKSMISAFVTAAVYSRVAGADGVEIHGAHAYLVNDFLSPYSNHRSDEYGGSLENRARFAREIISGIKAACGPDFVCGIRLGIEETVEGGYGMDEGLKLAQMMVDAGADYISASLGHTAFGDSRLVETHKHPEGARVYLAEAVKRVLSVPVFTTGKLRTPDVMDSYIEAGRADVLCLGRPLICDANWCNKVAVGNWEDARPCINCLEGCIIKVAQGQALQCAVNPTVGKEYRIDEHAPAEEKKKIVVVGGGAAGMEAARAAAQRGHSVTLFEKTDRLGGQINYAKMPPHKWRMGLITDWYGNQLEKLGVELKLGCEASFENIMALKPNLVVIAAGATPMMDKVPSSVELVRPWDILSGKKDLKGVKTVAMLGGGMVGCETTEYLSERGCEVTMFEMLPTIGTGAAPLNLLDTIVYFSEKGISTKVSTTVLSVDEEGVHYRNAEEGERCFKADIYVCAIGQASLRPDFAEKLEQEGIRVILAGDSDRVDKVFSAVHSGFYAGYDA